ncbi:polyketide cyclase [Streptomyces griseocarneus]|nr:polyketide cyclase [Streptomyces griseocarneus]
MVYHSIVRAKVRQAFAEISRGNWQAMVDGMAPEFTYVFYGDHALAGTRNSHETLRLWWQRIFRIMPDPEFRVRDVVVAGWPWNTTVATSVEVRATLPDGSRYENVMHQFLRMRWARIHEIRTLEETGALLRALDACAAAGIAEAHAAPLTDLP